MGRWDDAPAYDVDPDTGCWIWRGCLLNGYPMASAGRAHRVYYEKAKGPIPADHDVHHLCEVTACVNPDHLEALHFRAHDLEHFLNAKGRTFSDVLKVRADRARGMTFRQMAAKYGLSYSTVRRWCGNGLEPAWTDFVGEKVEFPEKVCARDGCDEVVVSRRPDASYCCANCRAVTSARRRNNVQNPRAKMNREAA